jgi:hypothetical protein
VNIPFVKEEKSNSLRDWFGVVDGDGDADG